MRRVETGKIIYTPKEVTGKTPFALIHGTEAVIPIEVGMESARVQNFELIENDRLLREDLDLVLEKREIAKEHMDISCARNKMSYDKKVRQRNFAVGDWVLRQADALKATGKLEANWEGPYRVICVLHEGAYKLADMDDLPVLRPWNIVHLKKYYHG